MAEKLYTCYETNQTMNQKDWFLYYLTSDEIDKAEYKDFTDWWHDMRKSGVIEVAQNNYFIQEGENMKENTYYLFDNGNKIAFSGSFERLLNKTTKTENAEIYYNNVLVWKQNPQKGVNNGKNFIIHQKIQW